MTTENKLIIHKQIPRPAQFWGFSKTSSINIIQSYENKIFKEIVTAPYVIISTIENLIWKRCLRLQENDTKP